MCAVHPTGGCHPTEWPLHASGRLLLRRLHCSDTSIAALCLEAACRIEVYGADELAAGLTSWQQTRVDVRLGTVFC